MVDEAAHDFLTEYNPVAETIRGRLGTPFPPTFEFGDWITGLALVVLVLLALSTFAFSGARPAVGFARVYAALMFVNGAAHVAFSIATGGWFPGVWSAPLLLVASAWLWVAASGARNGRDGTSARSSRGSRPRPDD